MTEKLLRKVIKEEDFIKYKINESFDKPFSNVRKIDNYNYVVDESDVVGNFTFRTIYNNGELPKSDIYVDKIKTYYEISWNWGSDMSNDLKTPYNWTRMTTTSFKIIDDFIRTINPNIIRFGTQTGGNEKIYRNEEFQMKLATLFRDHYHFIIDFNRRTDILRLYLINKEYSRLLEGNINKRAEFCTNLEESKKYWLYPHKRDRKGIIKNDLRKEQIKRILYQWKYLT